MSTPVDEKPNPAHNNAHHARRTSEDGTYVGEDLSHQNSNTEHPTRLRANTHLTVETEHLGRMNSVRSPSQNREQASRLDDDIAMLQIEREVSHQAHSDLNRNASQLRKTRSRRDDPVDDFDNATNPLHETTALYKPPENPTTSLSKFFKKAHNSIWPIRYFIYITPLVLVFLIPLLLGAFVFKEASVGGVKLIWFCIWLEIVWLTLWAGRVSCPVTCHWLSN